MDLLLGKVSNYRGTSPLMGKVLIGSSAICAFLSAYSWMGSRSAQNQIEFRKRQLSLPIHKLSEQEMVNPPWNKENIDEWLYRRVEVKGRPIHRDCCLIPRREFGSDGFEYVLPLLVKEDEDTAENQQGMIFSKGWIPFKFKAVSSRYKREDTTEQTFIGFVSRLDELKNSSFFEGNARQEGRLKYTCSDMDDFADSTRFVNKKQISVAMVERLFEEGILDERSSHRRNNDATFSVDYPYYKTESGALQLSMMPWDYKNNAKSYLLGSVLSAIAGASII